MSLLKKPRMARIYLDFLSKSLRSPRSLRFSVEIRAICG